MVLLEMRFFHKMCTFIHTLLILRKKIIRKFIGNMFQIIILIAVSGGCRLAALIFILLFNCIYNIYILQFYIHY